MTFRNITKPTEKQPTYRCPCCGHLTLCGRAGYEICPVCFWEDDGQDSHDADEVRGGPNIHISDGPRGERLHINVPVAVEAEYRHPFSPEFLTQQSESPDGLTRMIASELSHLRRKLLFTRNGARVSYGGASFDCITYVVQSEPRE